MNRRTLRRTRGISLALALATVAASLVLTLPTAHADGTVVRDGSTSALAAASCWEIKQNDPASTDGIYWLQTPALVAPQQFYCDQTTDGGGWVMIARGREGWNFEYTGQGTASSITANPTGAAAFTPVALNGPTVDSLLNGGRVDALTDGVRLRRAENTDGTQWQEVRFHFASRDRWNWTVPANEPLGAWSMTNTGNSQNATVTGSGGLSSSFGTDNTFARVGTSSVKAEAYKDGWDFGSSAPGSTSATSYIWKNTLSGARSEPFTQVFLRPKILSGDLTYNAIPDSGLAGSPISRPLPDTHALANPWGVGGLANGIDSVDDTEVAAITQVGNVMIVGGNFAYVEQDASGTGKVNQSYLAAFDATTGEWLPGFRPVLNNQVRTMAALPNGDIVVGGNFTAVNGTSHPAIVALNPTTGAVDPNWNVNLQQNINGADLYVRSLQVSGNLLYIGGYFSHLSGGGSNTLVHSTSAARVNVANGKPDGTWHPVFTGNINTLFPSADGTRVYLGGRFTKVNGVAATYFTALSTAAGSPLVPGLKAPQFSNTSSRYQQAIVEAGGRVWEGGAEHMLYSYAPSDLTLLSTNIAWNKGDFQVLTTRDGVVYGSCHCPQWVYSGAKFWPNPSGWSQADNLEYVGAWDATTGNYIPSFVPKGVSSRHEFGAWALTFSTDGTLWVGGDFQSATGSTGTRVFTGGFMRFPQADVTPPTVPTAPLVKYTATSAKISFTGSTDNGGKAVRYEILQNDRVIQNIGSTSLTLPLVSTPTRYFVRAIDSEGNRSATTSVITLVPQ